MFLPPTTTSTGAMTMVADILQHDAAVDYGGVLGNNCTTNPDFCDANAVFIHYCDGASFGGNRALPVAVRTKKGAPAKMWLRGRANFDAVVADLRQAFGLGAAAGTEVILSGGSAGGLAVFYNLDHLAALLRPNANVTRVAGFPDAGFFLDAATTAGAFAFRADFVGADPVWNVTRGGGTNTKCLAALVPKGEGWKCLMAQYLVPFIETPLYVMNSAYDAYQLPHVTLFGSFAGLGPLLADGARHEAVTPR